MRETAKALLTRLGRFSSPRLLHDLNSVVNYLSVGHWFARHGYRVERPTAERFELFEQVAPSFAEKRVAYLEFGVWEGYTLRFWSKRLTHPGSVLHGFDSFEGLPEPWTAEAPEQTFTTQGVPPKVDDPRVSFYKGWFEETLLDYKVPPHDVLFVALDADLYSSTRTVLNALKDDISVGTYLYFDEFSDRNHELRAFDEFVRGSGMKFRVVGATASLTHVIFQRVH
jgi:hypothetical protein